MDNSKQPLHITVLAGGISAERDVSMLSGNQIAAGLRRCGHHVRLMDISPTDASALDLRPCDLVFPVLHGVFGEDGALQEMIESRNLPYVGSGPAASRLAMDKPAAKIAMIDHGIRTPDWQVVSADQFSPHWTPHAGIGFPCIIKPAAEGSSVACRICRDPVEARAHLEGCFAAYEVMLVERYVQGSELTVGILDGQTLPLIQIRPKTNFYDYEAKYSRDDTEYLFDINLPPPVRQEISTVALRTYHCVDARHLARVDVMVDAQTLSPWVLEINTMPGFTGHSLVPKAAAQAGVDFDSLCDRLARMAVRDAVAPGRV